MHSSLLLFTLAIARLGSSAPIQADSIIDPITCKYLDVRMSSIEELRVAFSRSPLPCGQVQCSMDEIIEHCFSGGRNLSVNPNGPSRPLGSGTANHPQADPSGQPQYAAFSDSSAAPSDNPHPSPANIGPTAQSDQTPATPDSANIGTTNGGSPESSTDGNSPTPATGGDSSAGGAAADNHDNTTGDNSAGSALHQDTTTTVPDGNTTSDNSSDTSNVPDGDETSGNNEAQGISGNTDSTVVPIADDQSSTNPTGSTSTGDQGSSSSATAATTSDDASSGATANTTATQGPDNLDSTDTSATESQANTNTNPDSTDSGSASPGDQSSSSTADGTGSTSDNGTSVSAGTADSSTDTTPTASGTSGSSDTAADSGTSDNTPANGAPSTTGDTNFGPFNDFDAASPDVSGSHAPANPNRGTHRTDRVTSDCGGTACVAQEPGSPVGGVSADPVTGLMRTGTGGVLGAMGECTGQTDIGVCVDIATG